MVPHAPAAATRPAAADMPREVEFVGNPAHDGSVAVGGQRDRHALSGASNRAGADQLAALLGPDAAVTGVDPRRPCIGVVSSPACDSGAAVGGQRDGDALPGTPNCGDGDQLVALLGPDNAACGRQVCSNRGKSRGGQGGWVLARIGLASGGTAAPGRLSRAPR
jgi:hypothetical protein